MMVKGFIYSTLTLVVSLFTVTQDIDYEYTFTSMNSSSYSIVDNSNDTSTITINNVYSDRFYLVKVFHPDGTILELDPGVNTLVYSEDSYSYKRYIEDVFFKHETEYFTIFTPSDDNTSVSFTFDTVDEYRYSILRRTVYNEDSNKINENTSVLNDLINSLGYISCYQSNELQIVNMVNGMYAGSKVLYFYLYLPKESSIDSISLEFYVEDDENEIKDFSLIEISNSDNFYKYMVSTNARNYIESNDTYITLIDYNGEEKFNIKNQQIFYDASTENNITASNFVCMESSWKKIVADLSYYTIEDGHWLFGDNYYDKNYSYILFDLYIDNNKLSDDAVIENVEVNSTWKYDIDSLKDEISTKKYEFMNSLYSVYTEYYSDSLSKGVTHTDTVIPSGLSIWERINWWGKSTKKDWTVTELCRYDDIITDDADARVKMKFGDFTYACFIGQNEDDSFGHSSTKLISSTSVIDSITFNTFEDVFLVPVAYDFVNVSFNHKGVRYSINIDETDGTISGWSDPFGVETDTDSTNFFLVMCALAVGCIVVIGFTVRKLGD